MPTPVGSQVRKLVAATLALVGCRILSGWDSLLAGVAALTIILTLAVSIVGGMPRLRRVLLVLALPITTLANALVFALGGFVMLLGVKGLLPDGQIVFNGPPWNLAFGLVPLAAAANLVWLARPGLAPRRLQCIRLANVASAGYSVWAWYAMEGSARLSFPPPVATIVIIGLAIVSLATLAWDARAQASSNPAAPRRGRRTLVPAATLLIVVALGVAMFPVYRKRQVAHSLEPFGLYANFGVIFPGWRAPIDVPFDLYDYLGEISGVAAPETFKGDVGQAGRLLNSLPWLEFVIVNELPAEGERILQPLAGHARLRQIVLRGAGVSDEVLADACHIPGLSRAVFGRAQITDAGLANLAGAIWLQALVIQETPISGDGLVHLQSLPRLAQLDLSGTDIGDRQLAELPRFKTLVSLSLENTRVTDEGLASLARCKTLKQVNLNGTHVTESGVTGLRRALPACDVVWWAGQSH
jgi:hypothetical protein